MEDFVGRFAAAFVGQLSGPLILRLIVQPAVALVFAVRDGLHDARVDGHPHFLHIVGSPPDARHRNALETWDAVLKVFCVAVLLDCVYQLLVLRFVYPMAAMATATILTILPYVFARGLVSRLARTWMAALREVSR